MVRAGQATDENMVRAAQATDENMVEPDRLQMKIC
jgi:hypothetical protein